MDDLDLFTSLRPSVAVLDPDDRRALRAELFGPGANDPQVIDVWAPGPTPMLEPLPADRRPVARSVRPVWRSVAAAAVVVAIVGAGWITMRAVRERPAAPADAPETTALGGLDGSDAVVDTSRRPAHLVPDSSWTLTHAFERPPANTPRALVVDASIGLAGPWMAVDRISSDWQDSIDAATATTVPELQGMMQQHGDVTFLTWTGDDGTVWHGTGWAVSPAQLIAYADAVDRGDTTPPAGFLAASDPAVVGRSAEASFQDGTAQLDLRVYAGGGVALYQRLGSGPTTTVTVRDHPAFVVISEGSRQRVVWQDGFWVWEADGIDLGSLDAFLAVLDGLTVVDEATWNASLPDGIVGGDDRAAAVAEIVAGIPIPDGFDLGPLGAAGTTNDRYQLVAEVTGAVVCAWLDRWFSAVDEGDVEATAEVVAAFGTAHEWPALQEVAQQGGWSDVVWQFTDSVATGAPHMATGAGPIMPTRSGADSALGCAI